MSSGVISVLQPIVMGVDAVLGVGVGVADALGLPVGVGLAVSLGVGEGVGTHPLSRARARAETARGTTARRKGMLHCHPAPLSEACNTPAR